MTVWIVCGVVLGNIALMMASMSGASPWWWAAIGLTFFLGALLDRRLNRWLNGRSWRQAWEASAVEMLRNGRQQEQYVASLVRQWTEWRARAYLSIAHWKWESIFSRKPIYWESIISRFVPKQNPGKPMHLGAEDTFYFHPELGWVERGREEERRKKLGLPLPPPPPEPPVDTSPRLSPAEFLEKIQAIIPVLSPLELEEFMNKRGYLLFSASPKRFAYAIGGKDKLTEDAAAEIISAALNTLSVIQAPGCRSLIMNHDDWCLEMTI
jgi:hypothetical protein